MPRCSVTQDDAPKIGPKYIALNGKRLAVTYSTGPWIDGVDPGLIKIRRRGGSSLEALRPVFNIENNSDSREDYFEADSIRVMPSHPLYAQIRLAASGTTP